MAASNCLATRFAGHEHVHFNPTPSQPHPSHNFLMSKIPRNNMWSEVTWPGVMPSLRSVFNCKKSATTTMMPSGFKPSVLSFSNLMYTGQTLPFLIQPTVSTTTSIMHPFQGIAIVLTQSQFGSNDTAADDHQGGGHACNDDYVTDSTKYMKVESDHVDTESPHETHEFPHEAIKIAIECDQTHEYHYNTDKDVMWEDDCDTCDDCDSSDDDCDTCDDQCDSGDESEDGDDCVIDFQSCCHDVPTTTKEENDSVHHPLKGSSPPPHKNSVCVFLSHTFSFSSEESGFCDTSPNVEWSEDEDDDECDFNEGLWLEFEQKACFADIPIKTCKSLNKSSNNTKSHHSNHYHQSNNANKSHPPTTLNLDMLFAGSNDICDKSSSQVTSRQDSNKNDAMKPTVSSTTVITSTATHDHNHRRCTNTKRVTFKPDSKLAVVHHIIAWKYAYRASRRGPWEQYAADRERFKKRVHAVESVLTPCLSRKLSQVKSS